MALQIYLDFNIKDIETGAMVRCFVKILEVWKRARMMPRLIVSFLTVVVMVYVASSSAFAAGHYEFVENGAVSALAGSHNHGDDPTGHGEHDLHFCSVSGCASSLMMHNGSPVSPKILSHSAGLVPAIVAWRNIYLAGDPPIPRSGFSTV